MTATMRADKNNHMYPLITQLRNKLDYYINEFNKGFGCFQSQDFDHKFLENADLTDIVYFFCF